MHPAARAPIPATPPPHFRSRVERRGSGAITGYVYDPTDLTAKLVVELLVDGVPVALARAETYVESLHQQAIGDARYGFAFVLAPDILQGARSAQIVVANLHAALGAPIQLEDAPSRDDSRDEGAGQVMWLAGLELTGWLSPRADPAADLVRMLLDGEVVYEGKPNRWRHRPETGYRRPVPGFSLFLPAHCADGRTKRIVVTNGHGEALRGSPVSLVAFPEPLEAAVARTYGPDAGAIGRRARLLDRLLPQAMPFAELTTWLDRYPAPSMPKLTTPVAIVMIGDAQADVARTLDSLEAQTDLDWIVGALPSTDRIGFEPADLTAYLTEDAVECRCVIVVPAGASFQPGAPARLAAALLDAPEAELAYGDIALGSWGAEAGLAFPAFDYERWLEQGYGAMAFAVPTATAKAAARAGTNSLFHLATVAFGPKRPHHVLHVPGIAIHVVPPEPISACHHLVAATRRHLAMRGMPAQVQPQSGGLLPGAKVTRSPPNGRVSILIPTRDRADLLRACLASIQPSIDRLKCELIVIDNGSSDPDTLALLKQVQIAGGRVIREAGAFNYAHLCNRAAAVASGAFLLLLNNDIEAVREGWLDELLSRLGDPDVAAVGAVLRWPSDVVQHAGVVLGPGLSASHAFEDRLHGDGGYGDLLRVAYEPTAVTGACLLVRRDAYAAVGGLDAHRFPVNFNDIDLCLKLGARGHSIVVTPHLALIHKASASRGPDVRPDQVQRYARELAAFRTRWGEVLADDPAYSPLLALTDTPYAGLACPPRGFAARRRALPQPFALPAGT